MELTFLLSAFILVYLGLEVCLWQQQFSFLHNSLPEHLKVFHRFWAIKMHFFQPVWPNHCGAIRLDSKHFVMVQGRGNHLQNLWVRNLLVTLFGKLALSDPAKLLCFLSVFDIYGPLAKAILSTKWKSNRNGLGLLRQNQKGISTSILLILTFASLDRLSFWPIEPLSEEALRPKYPGKVSNSVFGCSHFRSELYQCPDILGNLELWLVTEDYLSYL